MRDDKAAPGEPANSRIWAGMQGGKDAQFSGVQGCKNCPIDKWGLGSPTGNRRMTRKSFSVPIGPRLCGLAAALDGYWPNGDDTSNTRPFLRA